MARRQKDRTHRQIPHHPGREAVERIEASMREHAKSEDRAFGEAIEAWARRARAASTAEAGAQPSG
jgi:hypothetical protein